MVLGLSLVLASLLNMGRIWMREGYSVGQIRIREEHSPAQLWNMLKGDLSNDYQESDEFREYICGKLADFLVIASGGDVYGSQKSVLYYYQPMTTYSIIDGETVAADEGVTVGESRVAIAKEEEAPVFVSIGEISLEGEYDWLYWDNWEEYLEEGNYSDEEVLELRARRRELEAQWQENAERYLELMKGDGNFLYRVVNHGHVLYANASRFGMNADKSFPPEYNFILHFNGYQVEIIKDGKKLDIYGDGYYRGDSQWYVPGYRNFPVSKKFNNVDIYLAAIREPVLYTNGDNNGQGYQQLDNTLYRLYQRNIERNAVFYQVIPVLSWILRAGFLLLVLGLIQRRGRREIWQAVGEVTGKIWIEWKILILLGAAAFLAFVLVLLNGGLPAAGKVPAAWGENMGEWGSGLLTGLAGVLAFWALCLAGNDLRCHGKGVWRQGLIFRLCELLSIREQKLEFSRRMANRSRILFLTTLGLEIVVVIFLVLIHGWLPDADLPAWRLVTVILVAGFAGKLSLDILSLKGSRRLGLELEALTDRISRIRKGDYGAEKEPLEDRNLKQAMEDLEEIRQGMEEAIEEQMKSERMKVELIANVSHDLKTPLTSIISYVQFLKQEENLPDYVQDYVRILDEKSQRLKNMVQDIFMVSKAVSGELPVNLENLDFAKLLRQTLADMEEEISGSDLTFRVKLPEEPVMIQADGQRLYRVFQNLIQNALKYSLEGSRIYVLLEKERDQAVASVKNISRMELRADINYAERFVRGDESRTDGGSGLGLSIAQSFTEACGGQFALTTDADLFVVKVTFPVAAIRES